MRALQQLGMPLYQCQPPTGYKDTADAWVNTGALVSRMNFALALAGGQAARRRRVGCRSPQSATASASAIARIGDRRRTTTRATIAKATDVAADGRR